MANEILAKFWELHGDDIRAQVDADKAAWLGLRATDAQATMADLQLVDMHGAVNARVHGGVLWLRATAAAPDTGEQREVDLEYVYTEMDGKVTIALRHAADVQGDKLVA